VFHLSLWSASSRGYPLPPPCTRLSGIIDLARVSSQNIEPQEVIRKIFHRKNLARLAAPKYAPKQSSSVQNLERKVVRSGFGCRFERQDRASFRVRRYAGAWVKLSKSAEKNIGQRLRSSAWTDTLMRCPDEKDYRRVGLESCEVDHRSGRKVVNELAASV
jgi:hypothetical protein